MKLATVHASKGLQWPAVLVPGLAAGEKSQVFPARPRLSTRWTDNARLIPFPLRGDAAADLPALPALDADSVAEFTERCADRDLAEERRLAVRGRDPGRLLAGLLGLLVGGRRPPASGRLRSLPRCAAACAAGTGRVPPGHPPPKPDAENPALAEPAAAEWPGTPAGDAATRPRASGCPGHRHARRRASARERAAEPRRPGLVAAWRRDAELLLAERERRRTEGGLRVTLPGHLSVRRW